MAPTRLLNAIASQIPIEPIPRVNAIM
jgi:hypothetical protein